MDTAAVMAIAGGLLSAALSMVVIVVIVYLFLQARTRREAQRLDFQTRLLERVGSAREFGEFLSTEPGHRFLDALTPDSARPHARMLAAVRAGIVLIVVAVGVFAGLENAAFRRDRDLVWDLVIVAAATGVGLLLAALVSYVIARRLGVLDRESGRDVSRQAPRPPQI
jgi:protein-S-isoprenylcysteine O-methyltransferase Ste14